MLCSPNIARGLENPVPLLEPLLFFSFSENRLDVLAIHYELFLYYFSSQVSSLMFYLGCEDQIAPLTCVYVCYMVEQ
jgi:hypothetical protein